MPRNKNLDQLFLLIAALAVISGLFWLINFMDRRGVSERMGFFVILSISVAFILTWYAVVSFRRTPGFWRFYIIWMIAHAAIAVAWAYSGYWIELCVLVLPLEAYAYVKIAKYRALKSYSDMRLPADSGSRLLD
jgi:hypothetical protein